MYIDFNHFLYISVFHVHTVYVYVSFMCSQEKQHLLMTIISIITIIIIIVIIIIVVGIALNILFVGYAR